MRTTGQDTLSFLLLEPRSFHTPAHLAEEPAEVQITEVPFGNEVRFFDADTGEWEAL